MPKPDERTPLEKRRDEIVKELGITPAAAADVARGEVSLKETAEVSLKETLVKTPRNDT